MKKKEDKTEVFKNKFKLKGESIFVEHDLSWEERKIKEEIGIWIKSEKEKSYIHKIGIGRVKCEGKWYEWEEMKNNMDKNKKDKTK